MHARLDGGGVRILTRRGKDWTDKYLTIAQAIAGLPARNAYLDGELCGVLPDGRTAFNLIQNATDTGQGSLVFFLFDLLHLDGENLMALPLVDRKVRLASLLNGAPASLRYNDHQIGQGPAFHRLACEHGLEGIVSKRTNGRYEPDRRTWLKIKCLNREEFVVVGWSDPEGSRKRWTIATLESSPHGRFGIQRVTDEERFDECQPRADDGRHAGALRARPPLVEHFLRHCVARCQGE
jgi:bifunctional non-homologous end joining protein LigD